MLSSDRDSCWSEQPPKNNYSVCNIVSLIIQTRLNRLTIHTYSAIAQQVCVVKVQYFRGLFPVQNHVSSQFQRTKYA